MGLIDSIIGLIAPHTCVGCRQEGTLLCRSCGDILADPTIYSGRGILTTVRAATMYEEFAKDLVWRLKFRGAQAATGVMARYMAPLIRPDDSAAIIIPVPTATRRVRQRGFDQAKLLGRQLSRLTGLRYEDCLRRYGQTQQVGASRELRLSQLENAFRLKPGAKISDKRVILIDDVMTTGATLEAAAGIMRRAGTVRLDAVVFARADDNLAEREGFEPSRGLAPP